MGQNKRKPRQIKETALVNQVFKEFLWQM